MPVVQPRIESALSRRGVRDSSGAAAVDAGRWLQETDAPPPAAPPPPPYAPQCVYDPATDESVGAADCTVSVMTDFECEFWRPDADGNFTFTYGVDRRCLKINRLFNFAFISSTCLRCGLICASAKLLALSSCLRAPSALALRRGGMAQESVE